MSADLEWRREYRQASQPVLKDLDEIGLHLESVADIWRFLTPSKKAAEILLRHLSLTDSEDVKFDIIRSLGKRRRGTVDIAPLIREFEAADPAQFGGQTKWGIGDVIYMLAGDSASEELVRLATDTQHGTARQMIVMGLGRMKRDRSAVVPALIELLDDGDVGGHAIVALGQLRAHEARQNLEQLTHHPNEWWRREARRALAKIEADAK